MYCKYPPECIFDSQRGSNIQTAPTPKISLLFPLSCCSFFIWSFYVSFTTLYPCLITRTELHICDYEVLVPTILQISLNASLHSSLEIQLIMYLLLLYHCRTKCCRVLSKSVGEDIQSAFVYPVNLFKCCRHQEFGNRLRAIKRKSIWTVCIIN